MVAGARTPEELETLLEDAFVMRDRTEFGALYDDGAVLVAGTDGREARGGDAIGHAVAELWAEDDFIYLAGARRVLRARDTALVIAGAGIHVLRRGADGAWRVAISVLDLEHSIQQERT
jgi:hypothetical protein